MINIFTIFCLLGVLAWSLGAVVENAQGNSSHIEDNTGTFASESGESDSITDLHERALVLIKPDAVDRKLVGKIIERFENKGFKLVGIKILLATKEMAKEHYRHLAKKWYFDTTIDYITSGPVTAMVWEGENANKIIDKMKGAKDLLESAPGTIRGDFSISRINNVIHASDSVEAANREINIWFKGNEIIPHDVEH